MKPILVPTLSELGVELEKATSTYGAAVASYWDDPEDETARGELAHAAREVFEIAEQIVILPAASLADLRVKAKALKHLFEAVPSSRPTGPEQQHLVQQIIAALIDERIS